MHTKIGTNTGQNMEVNCTLKYDGDEIFSGKYFWIQILVSCYNGTKVNLHVYDYQDVLYIISVELIYKTICTSFFRHTIDRLEK